MVAVCEKRQQSRRKRSFLQLKASLETDSATRGLARNGRELIASGTRDGSEREPEEKEQRMALSRRSLNNGQNYTKTERGGLKRGELQELRSVSNGKLVEPRCSGRGRAWVKEFLVSPKSRYGGETFPQGQRAHRADSLTG